MKYIFASLYHSIRRRRPSGTPYFNTRLLISASIALHILQFSLFVKWLTGIELLPHGKVQFVVVCMGVGTIIMSLLSFLIPYKTIIDIKVSDSHVNMMNYCFFCIFLSILFYLWYFS